jgi:hypothetical protein
MHLKDFDSPALCSLILINVDARYFCSPWAGGRNCGVQLESWLLALFQLLYEVRRFIARRSAFHEA